jgi:hypothetical protein
MDTMDESKNLTEKAFGSAVKGKVDAADIQSEKGELIRS